MPAEHRQAIDQRAELIEIRARALVATAVDINAAWYRRLGTPPTEPQASELWTHAAMTVAACRDRHQIDSDQPLDGGEAATAAERADRQWARRALRQADRLSRTAHPEYGREAPALPAVPSLERM